MLSQKDDNGIHVRWQWAPEANIASVELSIVDHPFPQEGEYLVAALTPDQMRTVVAWWMRNDPGETWPRETSSTPSTD